VVSKAPFKNVKPSVIKTTIKKETAIYKEWRCCSNL